jgi:trans-L-3-hydroxyproline dehydratase
MSHTDLVARYGAILRPNTELVAAGKAHIGVFFMHHGGYSTMCGHGTIALGKFLIDTHDLSIFPQRESLQFDAATGTVKLLLHSLCGVVEVTCPALDGGKRSDPSRQVSFLSVPVYSTALDLKINIPDSHRWPELGDRKSVSVDISYGGTFFALISASSLGFPSGLLPGTKAIEISGLSHATGLLKDLIMSTPDLKATVVHPEEDGLSFLSGIMVVDSGAGAKVEGTKGVETGMLFFGDQVVDRSPTGSGVAARIAVAQAKGILQIGDSWTYHSFVSNGYGGQGAFVGEVMEVVDVKGIGKGVVVRTRGQAWYTGSSTYVVDKGDKLGYSGFRFSDLTRATT